MDIIEEWRPVFGYEGIYEISSIGRFKCLPRKVNNRGKIKIRKEVIHFGHDHSFGYKSVILRKDGKSKNKYVHRMIAESFIPNPNNLKTVNHINGNKKDNKVGNLEWMSYSQNCKHAYDKGLSKPPRGEISGKSKLSELDVLEILKLRGLYSQRKIGYMYGVSKGAIQLIMSGKNWKHLKVSNICW